MKQQIYAPNTVPTAGIAVNKSRLKVYNNAGKLPTYYLQKGQEFQIELFNPTTGVVLAKITLNGKTISQGGLVLNPGQRVFLDRYLDVPKKFLFDTYDVANTEEVKKAIEDNGDIKVEFFKETILYIPLNYNNYYPITIHPWPGNYVNCYHSHTGGPIIGGAGTLTVSNGSCGTFTNTAGGSTNINGNISGSLSNASTGSYTTSSFNSGNANTCADGVFSDELKLTRSMVKKSKSIETGRVEMGSESDQKFKTVSKDFDYWAFHTIEYKMLPVSQKVNSISDISVKVYCTSCGAKLGKTDRFCSSCGTRA